MSIMDMLNSLSLLVSTATSPKESSSHIYGAKGNQATCTIQSLFMIMGFSVPFYNAFLTLYYMGVIKYNMSDDTLAKYELPAYLISILWPLIVRIFAISVNLFIHEFIWSVPDMAINVPLLKMRRIVHVYTNTTIVSYFV